MTKEGSSLEVMQSEEAAGWVVRMASDQRTRGDEEAFAAWLARDPGNEAAYADHAAFWNGVGALAGDEEARAILGVGRPTSAVTPLFGRRKAIGAGLAAAAAVAAGGAFLLLPGAGIRTFETIAGEQRRLSLADGSSVMLNTDTRLAVSMDANERRIMLERGQAYFNVASDPARPFRVFAGEDEVRAIGTAFEVRRIGNGARIVLEEGTVALYRGTRERRPVAPGKVPEGHGGADRPLAILQPGQQAELSAADPRVSVAEVDLRNAQAWRFGRLVLDEARLGETVAELNRYGGRRILLGDPSLADLRVSGVFHTSRPEAFVDGISAALPVRVARQDEHSITLQPR